MKIQIIDNWIKGIGTQICALSVFLNAGVDCIEIKEIATFNALTEFKKIFNLDNLQINYVTFDLSDAINPGDCFKLFSPYFKKPILHKSKPYIGIACYDNHTRVNEMAELDLSYPKNKMYPLSNYADIFKIIKKSGYDIISFDSKDSSLSEKVWLIENLCECVIGYEGGIAHLCHTLNVPYIMLPWRKDSGLEQLLHLDNKTWFLNSIHELLNFVNQESNYLRNIIDILNQGKGNNKFLTGRHFIVIDDDLTLRDTCDNFIPIWFNDSEKKFIKNNIHTLKLGG